MCQPDDLEAGHAHETFDRDPGRCVLPLGVAFAANFPECTRRGVVRVLREGWRRVGAAISKGGPAHHAIKRLAGGPAQAWEGHQQRERG
jgi:hypothetical protein